MKGDTKSLDNSSNGMFSFLPQMIPYLCEQ